METAEDKKDVVLEMNGNKPERLSEGVKGIRLRFDDISVKIGKTLILDDVFGYAVGGTVTAILGPSGSGKTTLLNALAGRIRLRSGQVTANEQKYSKIIRRTVNFVEQDDLFFADLTLWETLMFRAMFTLPSKLTYKEKKERVQEVIDILDLNKCKSTRIGSQFAQGLSGGEKKRTSIAAELISNPTAILLDEPTSGLDSTIAFELLRTVCTYAKQHDKTIILTIHQPSSQMFYAFDQILLLYEGKVGYFGKVNNVLDHLDSIGLPCMEHYNPADHLLDLAKANDEETLNKLASGVPFLKEAMRESYELHSQTDKSQNELNQSHEDVVAFAAIDKYHDSRLKWQSSFFQQTLALSLRELKFGMKIVYATKGIIANAIFVLMFAILAFQLGRTEEMMNNVMGVMFAVVTYLYFGSIRDELFLHQTEKDIVKRERASGLYRLSAHVASKFLVIALARPGVPLLIWTGVYCFCLLDGFVKYLITLCIVYYITLVFTSLNKLTVVIGQDQSTVASLTTVMGLSSYLTTGFWLRKVPIWMSWAMYALPLRYGDNALLTTLITPDTLIICRKNGTSIFDECNQGAMNVTAHEFLKDRTIYPSPGLNVAILTAYLILLWALIIFILRVFRTPKH